MDVKEQSRPAFYHFASNPSIMHDDDHKEEH